MKSLTVIGAGRVGSTLAHLWVQKKVFTVTNILNRSVESAERACGFIGEGKVRQSFSRLSKADFIMLACRDDKIESISADLSVSGVVREGTIVFHLSGAHAANALKGMKEQGAFVASAHPVKSFVDAKTASRSFAGTFCGLEGDREALDALSEAFAKIGAWSREIRSADKPLYHAAPVFACNYLTTLLSASLSLYEQVGIEREAAIEILRPLVAETVENNWSFESAEALTGPIARGDGGIVRQQLEALSKRAPELLSVYATLGENTLALKPGENEGDAALAEVFSSILKGK